MLTDSFNYLSKFKGINLLTWLFEPCYWKRILAYNIDPLCKNDMLRCTIFYTLMILTLPWNQLLSDTTLYKMFTISTVCLLMGVLISALSPICICGDKVGETCTGDSATLETEQECVSTESLGNTAKKEKPFEQDKHAENGGEPVLSDANSEKDRAKLEELKRKEVGTIQEMKQSELTKLVEENVLGKVTNETEQKKKEASSDAVKPKPKGNTQRAVFPSTEPDRVASAVNNAIKDDNVRRADENKKVHLDIEEYTERQAAGSSEGSNMDVHLALQVCGDRMPETVVLLKSARMLSRVHLHFHIFAEEQLKFQLKQQV